MHTTINRHTGFTPNMMMLGREVMLPVDLMFGSIGQEETTSVEYVKKLQQNFSSSPYPCKGVLAVQSRKTEEGL